MLYPLSLPSPGERRRFSLPHGSADALILAQWARAGRPWVVITANAADAYRLKEELPFFQADLAVHLLPDWETLPYDPFSPHQDLVSERLASLFQLLQGRCRVALIPLSTALYRLPPVEYLAAHTFFLQKGATLSLDALRRQLVLAGYSAVDQVVAPGEFGVRGGLVDLFPMGSPLPYRVELFDEQVESIRTFDVDTQRTIYPVDEVRLLPAREFPLDEAGQALFRRNFRERFEGDPSRSRVYRDVSQGLAPPGIEYYLPLFFERTAVFTDYFPADTIVCVYPGVLDAIREFWRDAESRYQLLGGDRSQPLLPPQDLFLPEEQFFSALKAFPRLEWSAPDADRAAQEMTVTRELPPLAVDRRAQDPLGLLRNFLGAGAPRTLLLAESPGRRETLRELLEGHGLKPAPCRDFAQFVDSDASFMLGAGPLAKGFDAPGESWAIVTEQDLFTARVRPRTAREAVLRAQSENLIRDLSELKIGDPVVHEQHGVGRYLGLLTMDLGEGESEFLALEYEGGDRLYVPVAQLHLVGRYAGGPPESAPLHRLGSGHWEKARRKAAAQARDTAAELLGLYALRAARSGYAFRFQEKDYEVFREGFPFEETPDQAAAIQAVLEDLRQGKPMDRLVCGDVGFGKTEVALRGAFVAVTAGKQVAVLVPTTLLAEQHYQTFSDRFADWPVRIAELSRFRSSKQQTEALAGLANGSIDIVIGTHKLLQAGVKFKDLGLVIIDEEHRFGVRQKDRLKALRSEVDVLTLTATPIPRTLALSLEGLRDFSVITTAPERRLSIKTFVAPYADGLVREACLRELKRGGQIYYLHNEVQTIRRAEERLTRLLPEARIRVAHGQMRERELEYAMRDFYQQRFNLLLCTTIIETGIDVPSANTIVIERADKFGLAQLHQLRGRVGRSHHQAYAYLLTPEEETITAQARKRLEAIQLMGELGAGFYLAMQDLEIRGAGEVLGESQSGEMQEVGFHMYAGLLEHAVKSLRQGKEPDMEAPLNVVTEINLHVPALLPAPYCPDVHERLVLYKRLASCGNDAELERLTEELVDRFGLLPEPARHLLETHRLRLLAQPLGVARLDAGAGGVQIQFAADAPVDPARLIQLIQGSRGYRLAGQDRLRIEAILPTVGERVALVKQVFQALAPAAPVDSEA